MLKLLVFLKQFHISIASMNIQFNKLIVFKSFLSFLGGQLKINRPFIVLNNAQHKERRN